MASRPALYPCGAESEIEAVSRMCVQGIEEAAQHAGSAAADPAERTAALDTLLETLRSLERWLTGRLEPLQRGSRQVPGQPARLASRQLLINRHFSSRAGQLDQQRTPPPWPIRPKSAEAEPCLPSTHPSSTAVSGRRSTAPSWSWRRWDGYRSFRQSSEFLDQAYVSVSADVVVAEDDDTARELATAYGPWVRSIRTAEGAIEFRRPTRLAPSPVEREGRRAGAGHVDTRFVGSPGLVADRPEQLQEATDADELLITTIHTAWAGDVTLPRR